MRRQGTLFFLFEIVFLLKYYTSFAFTYSKLNNIFTLILHRFALFTCITLHPMIGYLRVVMPIDFDRYDCQNGKLEFNANVVADPERFDCPLQTVEQTGEGQDARQWN